MTSTRIPDEYIQDEKLSWAARGLHHYLMSLPKSHRMTASEIIKNGNVSKDTYYRLIKEIEDAGYRVNRRRIRKKGEVAEGSKRPPQYVWSFLRRLVFKRDNYTCVYCEATGVYLECDHVVPVSRGGSNEVENLVTACRKCNRSKKDKLLNEWNPDIKCLETQIG